MIIYISETDTGTDPNNADTDGDGLSDGAEVLSTYEIVSGSYSWEEARLDALNRGGRLAVLSNENKLNQVMDLLVSEGDTLPRNRVWIGAQKVDGQWKWIDGTDWSLGFITPFLDPDGGQLYVTLTTAENHEAGLFDWPGYAWPWDSQFGDYSTSYILEKEGLGTDPNNADTDGDGVNDGDEVTNEIPDPTSIEPPASLAGKSVILTALTGESKSVPDQVTFTADTISFGFSGNLLETVIAISYSDGTVIYDAEEVIEFTYTSATGGTYEEGYDEGQTAHSIVENTGTFEEANISLSLQTNWQRSETMDSPVSTQYWQIGATSGDSVAYNEGELNFIFDSG